MTWTSLGSWTWHLQRCGRRGRSHRDAGGPMRRVDLPLCQIGARLSPHVDLVNIYNKRFIDVVDSPSSVMSGLSGLCDCVTISYAARPVSRQDVNKLRIDDSKLQIDDSTLQIGDSTLRIGDSTLQIGDSKCATVACECYTGVQKCHLVNPRPQSHLT